jgi:hypothetical protein
MMPLDGPERESDWKDRAPERTWEEKELRQAGRLGHPVLQFGIL